MSKKSAIHRSLTDRRDKTPPERVRTPTSDIRETDNTDSQTPYTEQDRMDIYKQLCQQIQEAKLKNAEQFDKAILTLSSGALVFSIAFIKDIVPFAQLVWKPALLVTWILFAASMLSTIFSFMSSQRAHDVQSTSLEAYFLRNEQDACNRPNRYTTITVALNRSSAFCFLLALLITIAFAWKNVSQEHSLINRSTVKLQENTKMEEINTKESSSSQSPIQTAVPDYQTTKLVPEGGDGLGAKPPDIPTMPPPKKNP